MKRILYAAALTAVTLGATAADPAPAKGPLDPSELNNRINQYGQILSVLQERYVDSLEMDKIIRKGIDAMLGAIDPYTEFYDRSNIEQLTSISSGEYGGIGSAIQLRDSVVVMSGPYFTSPARKAGVRHGDILLAIDGEAMPKSGIKLDDVSARLKGNPGTRINLRLLRPWLPEGSDSIFDVEITRDKIQMDPLPYSGVLDGGIGYFNVTTFNANTASEIRKAFEAMKADKTNPVKGVILDLRNNGGGIINGAIDLLSIFLDRGTPVVESRYRDGSVNANRTRKGPVDTHIPLVVMVNGNTASASEIVAGAIQDLDRGVIIGRRSFGKGLIQTSAPVSNDGVMKYTVGKYYLPSGRLIQALDYINRNEDGTPALVADSLTTAYKTRHGREVRNGRGIAPDVELEAQKGSQLAYQLYAGNWFDDFANRYRNTHDVAPDPEGTIVTDEVFADFKAFVDPTRLKYGEISQAGIDYLRQAAKAEGLDNDSIKAAIDNLEKLIKHDLSQEIDANRDEITEMLDSEIASRYFPDSTVSARVTRTDDEVEQARLLLLDPDRYRSLLLPAGQPLPH